jgi:EamA domain-containing membrane protein RarD
MLGPSIAVFLSLAFLAEKRFSQGVFLASIVAVLIGSRSISNALTPRTEISWIPPLMATCFAAYLLFRLYTEPAKGADSLFIQDDN